MDSSIVLFVVVLSTVSGQTRLPCLQEICLHCFSVDLSTVAYKAWLYGNLFCYFVEDSSIVLFVVVLSSVSGQIRLPCLQEIHLHCFSVDSSTVTYKGWLYGCRQFMFRFILA